VKKRYQLPSDTEVERGVYIQFLEDVSRTEEPHTHPLCQVIFVFSGSLTHTINGISATIASGEMAIIPAGVTHFVLLGEHVSYCALSFRLPILGEVCAYNEQTVRFLRMLEQSDTPLFPKTTLADRDILHTESLLRHIDAELSAKESGYLQNVTAYVILLINQFIRRYFLQNPSLAPQEEHRTGRQAVLAAIKHVDDHFTEELTLPEMARRASVSPSTFCYYFKELTGKSFTQYLCQCRIAHANELIKKGYAITVVGSLCGFGDFSSFSRSYRRVMGISPSRYRKTVLEK